MGIERICPFCGSDSKGLKVRARSLADRSNAGGGHVVTFGLVVVNLALFLLVVMIGGLEASEGGFELMRPDTSVLLLLGLQQPELVAMGEWWRLVMPIFLHLGLLHLIMNTLVLWLTGRHLESDIGGPAFFVMYMTAGVLGFVASQFAGIGGGGASGAVAGILGCTIVKRRLSDGNFRHPVTAMAIQLVVINAIFGLMVSQVNNVAHLGGLLSGAALGVPFALWQGRKLAARVWLVGALALGALTVTAVVMTIVNQPPAWRGEVQRAIHCHDLARTAADQPNQTVVPGPAIEAIQCLERLGPMDTTGDALIGQMKRGLALARDGRLDGSRRSEIQGFAELRDGLLGFKRWVEADPKLLMP